MRLFLSLLLLLCPALPGFADSGRRLAEKTLCWLQAAQADSILAHSTPEVRAQMPAAVLNTLWTQVRSQMGDLQPRGSWEHSMRQGYHIYTVLLSAGKVALNFNVTIDTQRCIAGFTLTPATPRDTMPAAQEKEGGAFTEREVAVAHGSVKLPGTLTLPKDTMGKCPIAVLVAGSGPCDRDETAGPNKPFRELARRLAEKGIASLRYDKRTLVYGSRTGEVSGGKTNFDTEVTEDAAQALALAATFPETDSRRVYLVAHSLGAMLAPRIVERAAQKPAGVVMLAAPARPLAEAMGEQFRYIVSLSGLSPAKVAEQADTLLARTKASLPPEYWEDAVSYQPTADVRPLLPLPLLFVQGGHDYQVTGKDLDLWREAMEKAGKGDARFRLFPALDHLLRPLPRMAVPADYAEKGEMSREATDRVAEFILKSEKTN